MNAAGLSLSARARALVLPVLCGLLLALAMIQLPKPMDIDPGTAHRTLLYETLRLGRTWTDAGPTTEGPLAALQTPAYLSGSFWMALTWQIGGNLLLAAIFIAAAWRLAWPRRAWALVFLAAVFSRWSELAPWLVIVLLGHDLIRRWEREPVAVLPAAAMLGFLALFSVGHLLLAAFAIGVVAFTARPPLAKVLAAGGFIAGTVGGWLLLAQPLPGFLSWLRQALSLLGQTSPAWRLADLGPFAPWAAVSAAGFAVVLLRHLRIATDRPRSLPGGIFLAVATWLAWKAVGLQAYGTPLVFFGTILLGGFLLWHHGCRTRWAAALMVLALTGLARGHPDFLTNAVGHFNRQIRDHHLAFAGWTKYRADVRAQVSALRNAHHWPKISAATGGATVGADADALPRAMFNNLALVYPPGTLTGPTAPAFFVQGLAPTPALAPALIGAPTQLALDENYEPVLEENGYFLWRRKSAPVSAPTLVATGALPWGEPLQLPAAADTAYWIELDLHPGILGRVWSLLDEMSDPGLLVRDASGTDLRYALPPATAAKGFLVDPLIHGNVEFRRWQQGEPPTRTAEITVVAPPAGAWLWSQTWHYRLYAVPGPKLTGSPLPDSAITFSAFNRTPVGAVHSLSFVESPAGEEPLLFVHPESLLEFVVQATDRRVRGSFGISPGAYETAGRTDGVDFSIEFLGLDGHRDVLLHRYVNPGGETADRGAQQFDVALPAATSGRLIFRSFNPPHRNAAWDWAYWGKVVIE